MKFKDVTVTEKTLAWRDRALRRIPTLLERNRELKGNFFTGCGFHYGYESGLAYLEQSLYELDENSKLWEQIVQKVILEDYEKTTREKELDVQRRAKDGKESIITEKI